MQSHINTRKQSSGAQTTCSTSAHRFPPAHYDRKALDLQGEICKKSTEIRIASIELAGIQKQLALLCTATRRQFEPLKSVRFSKPATTSPQPPQPARRDSSVQLVVAEIVDGPINDKYAKYSADALTNKSGGMSMWKQAISRWRKTGDQKEKPQDEPQEIDPIYSLLRCATALPRQAPSATGSQPTLASPQSAQPVSSPTCPTSSNSPYQEADAKRRGSVQNEPSGSADDTASIAPYKKSGGEW